MIQLEQNMISIIIKTMAKELEAQGAHILAIKDMAGLLKPECCISIDFRIKRNG